MPYRASVSLVLNLYYLSELALPASLLKWQSHSVYSLPTVTMLRTTIVPLIIKRLLSYSCNNDNNATIFTRSERLQHYDGADN